MGRILGGRMFLSSGVCDTPPRCLVDDFRHSPVPVRGHISVENGWMPRMVSEIPVRGFIESVFLIVIHCHATPDGVVTGRVHSLATDMDPLTGMMESCVVSGILIWIP